MRLLFEQEITKRDHVGGRKHTVHWMNGSSGVKRSQEGQDNPLKTVTYYVQEFSL
jgi:hypothetical protein